MNEEIKEQNEQGLGNPELPVIPGVSDLPDVEGFEGARVAIEGWEIIEVNSNFSPETGEKLELPVRVKKLKVVTTPLAFGKRNDESEFPIRASALFGLKKSKSGEWGLSSHPSSNIQKFFKKLKVNTLQDIKGKYVTVTVDENNWLRIVY